MQDGAALEELGVPAAVIVTETFVHEARVQGEAVGMKDLSPVVISHPLSSLTAEEIAERAAEAAPRVREVLLGKSIPPRKKGGTHGRR
jgi:hypothetical protein